MPYSLIQLAPGAFDLLLNNVVMGSVVRNGSRQPYSWTAELLGDLPQGERPAPFTEIEHSFASLEQLREWLGNPELKTNNPHGDAWER